MHLFNSKHDATRVVRGPPQNTLNRLIVRKAKALRAQSIAQPVSDSSAVQSVVNAANQIARTPTAEPATPVIRGPPQHTLNRLIVRKAKALRAQLGKQSVANSSAVQFVVNAENQIARTPTAEPATRVVRGPPQNTLDRLAIRKARALRAQPTAQPVSDPSAVQSVGNAADEIARTSTADSATPVIHGPPQHTLDRLAIRRAKALRAQSTAQPVFNPSAVQSVGNAADEIARTSTIKPAIPAIGAPICNLPIVATSCPSITVAQKSVGETVNQPFPVLIATSAEETEFHPVCSSTSVAAVNLADKTAVLLARALIEMPYNKTADKTLNQSVCTLTKTLSSNIATQLVC